MTYMTPEETARVIELSMHFAREGMTEELAGFVDHGLPVDVQDDDRNTALMLAAYHGHTETVGMLLERGADVDLVNNRNQTPVAGALFKGEDEVVRLLVGAGADLDAGTPTGRDAAAMFDRLDLLRRIGGRAATGGRAASEASEQTRPESSGQPRLSR